MLDHTGHKYYIHENCLTYDYFNEYFYDLEQIDRAK